MKDELVRQFLEKWDVDVYGMTEPNVNWSKVKKKNNWWERTEPWFETRRLAVAYNIHRGQLAKKAQYGGTITLSRNEICHRGAKTGYDNSGLGRWSWISFRGKKNCTTRVITAYCAVYNMTGPNTVYSQQLKFLNKDPIKAFWDDLASEIHKWQLQGDQIVLMGDWNKETHSAEFVDWYDKLGLIDPILRKHGQGAPPTYNKGSKRIDGILISGTLKASRCGFLAFDALPGDHRVLYIDIKTKSFIGHRPSNIPTHAARRLKLDDPRVVEKYQMEVERILLSEGAFHKAKRLQDYVQVTGNFDAKAASAFEVLDTIRVKAMKRAEQRCRKLKMGGKQWSPALQRGRDTILLWTLVLRRSLGRHIGAKRILRLKKKLKVSNTLVSTARAQKEIELAFKAYKVLRKKDTQLSKSYREELARAKAEEGNSSVAGIIRGLAAKESQRKVSRRIKRTLGKGSNKGTTKIEIQMEDGSIREITDPEEMNGHIADENRSKFYQTRNCPLLREELLKDLGLLGDGPEVINVLNGTYSPPPGTPWAVKRWLQHMKISNPIARKEIVTSLRDYRQGWKKANEKTASGELHMGHFKAAARHKRLGWFNFLMAIVPYSAGYVPNRWKKGTDVMILKEEEVFLLSKLRTIVLYEADYNHENKRLGRAAMKQAIKSGNIAREQFSRPSRSSQENVICKRLIFDYCRGKKKAMGMCACDLKSCYDRIVHVAASLALQRVGVPLGKIKSMFGAVQQLVHKIRTLYGDSECSYGGPEDVKKEDLPPQGTGQGNGAGPTIWSVLSSTVFEILHAEGLSTDIIHSISLRAYKLCGFSYVDDCDLFTIGDDVTTVYSKLQRMLQMWDELMEVNGGAIAPNKCWWYLTDFQWRHGKAKMIDASTNRSLVVRDKDQQFHNLQSLNPSQAREMLGVYLAPDGNEKEALRQLQNKTTSWTNFIAAGDLDWFSTWQALKTTITKSLCYALPALTLPKKALDDISTSLHSVALPRSGFARTFPKKVLYGPREFQGLGLENLYLEQYIPKVKAIVDFAYKDATSKEIVLSNLEVTKLEAGIPGPLFEYEYRLSFLTGQKSWIAETKDFCWENNIYFEERGKHLTPKRENDQFLMDVFVRSGKYSDSELKILLRCRLYLQVSTLSDIVSGDGKSILDDALNGKNRYLTGNHDWPIQARPPNIEWTFWAKVLQRHFAPELLILTKPLGPWTISDDEDFYTSWEWWTSEDNKVFQYKDRVWYKVEESDTGTSRRSRSFSTGYSGLQTHRSKLDAQPSNLRRTAITPIINNTFGITGSSPRYIPRNLGSTYQDNQLLDRLLQHEDAWLFQCFNQYCPTEEIILKLYSGEIVAVSDGSFLPRKRTGSAGWCLATKQGAVLLEGGGLIPGLKGQQSAYRSECGGILGSVTVCLILVSLLAPPDKYTFQIACDGEGALYQCISMPRDKISSSMAHADIISRVKDRLLGLSCNVIASHVSGHQDDKSKKTLSVLERLNVRMDSLAEKIMTAARETNICNLEYLPPSKDGLPTVSLLGTPLPSNLSTELKDGINTIALKEWWISKKRFRAADDPYIDWAAMVYCMRNCDSRYKRFIPKWVSRQIAVGKVMRFRNARVHNRCPRCNAFVEDTTHVLRCQTRYTISKWEILVGKLLDWLTKVDTAPEISFHLCLTLRRWRKRRGTDNYVNPDWTGSLKRVFEHQASLGWHNFLEGILSTGWADLQQKHYDSISSQKKGAKWAGSLSIQLWKLVFGMWEDRNKALFETSKISEFRGSRELKAACLVELELGVGELDELYHPYLDIDSEELFKENLDYQRNWFSIVRQAREKKHHIYSDIFSTCVNTRAWAGLEPLQCSVE